MTIEVDNKAFCIRLYTDVVYLKATGHHGKEEAAFFDKTVDQLLLEYEQSRFASICNFKDLILSDPIAALEINKSISKIARKLDYACNAIVIKPKFFEIMKAYVFSFYLKNINVKTKVFYKESDAFAWLEENGFDLKRINQFVDNEKLKAL